MCEALFEDADEYFFYFSVVVLHEECLVIIDGWAPII